MSDTRLRQSLITVKYLIMKSIKYSFRLKMYFKQSCFNQSCLCYFFLKLKFAPMYHEGGDDWCFTPSQQQRLWQIMANHPALKTNIQMTSLIAWHKQRTTSLGESTVIQQTGHVTVCSPLHPPPPKASHTPTMRNTADEAGTTRIIF